MLFRRARKVFLFFLLSLWLREEKTGVRTTVAASWAFMSQCSLYVIVRFYLSAHVGLRSEEGTMYYHWLSDAFLLD